MYLFVYGTLRQTPSPRGNNDAHSRFLSQASYCDTASVDGQLISLGTYPALILNSHAKSQVKGEIFKIEETDLQKLDEYEEIDPHSNHNQYQRVQKEIIAESGMHYSVWVYVLNNNAGDYEIIESGDWCA
jgi:gamma-glutamylcyclotransferase (GGCT)/AIG2-like uncharacterized protein YtfP